MSTINPPKALLFDVFGTLVDWRTTVTHTLSTQAALALNSPSASVPTSVRLFASTISWPDFAQQWHDTYKTFTSSQSSSSPSRSKHPFKTADQHHHDSLLHLLHTHSLTGLCSLPLPKSGTSSTPGPIPRQLYTISRNHSSYALSPTPTSPPSATSPTTPISPSPAFYRASTLAPTSPPPSSITGLPNI
ncbi:MAG: hypothetical protein Q9200_007153 [Gallowayella weberi]